MTVVPHPNYFSVFFHLRIKLKGGHFDTTEVIEADSEAVLNTLTEHDFQDGRSAGNVVLVWKRTTSSLMVASRSKVSF
jgi:hypothetical protein